MEGEPLKRPGGWHTVITKLGFTSEFRRDVIEYLETVVCPTR